MILGIILNYILGYVSIKVESVFIERFLNICANKKILIWNIKREGATILYANIGIKDFKKLRIAVKRTKSNLKIIKKKGIPFIINNYRKRRVFLILSVTTIILFVILSNYIWNIEINGTNRIAEEDLIKVLAEEGLKLGANKKHIDIAKIINSLRLKENDISWIGIDIKGTNAIINIKESELAPEIIDRNEVCNIISDKTGIIEKIDIQEGTAAVKKGDIVTQGEILVYGYIDGKYTDRRYVHGEANIEARVWYLEKERFYYKQCVPKYTGNEENKYELYINNFKINFYKTLSKFQNYDTIIANKKLIFFPNFYLPIIISKKTNKEYEIIEENYTEEQLTAKGIKILEDKLFEKIQEKDIVDKKINIYKEQEYIELEIIYEVMESIGIRERINI